MGVELAPLRLVLGVPETRTESPPLVTPDAASARAKNARDVRKAGDALYELLALTKAAMSSRTGARRRSGRASAVRTPT